LVLCWMAREVNEMKVRKENKFFHECQCDVRCVQELCIVVILRREERQENKTQIRN